MRSARCLLECVCVVALSAFGCSGREFTARGESGGAAGFGGEAGAAAAVNDAGMGGTAGDTAGQAGSDAIGGEAGTGSKACSCALGQYCERGTTRCRSCKDFSELHFDKPRKLSTLSHGTDADQRFPRPGASDTDLFYRFQNAASGELWYTQNPIASFGAQVELAAALNVGGALYVPGVFDGFNLLYELEQAGGHDLKMGNWDGATLSATSDIPAPLSGADDFGLAIATKTGRAWWMSDRKSKGTPKLVTESITASVAGNEVEVEIMLSVGNMSCKRSPGDATAWVTPDGTLLLFRNPTLDETCAHSDESANDLYAVALDVTTGLPTANAKPLSSVNVTSGNANETDPALSADGCFLYFASSSGATNGRHSVFRAARD
jgi:hypothetical protein